MYLSATSNFLQCMNHAFDKRYYRDKNFTIEIRERCHASSVMRILLVAQGDDYRGI